MDSYPKFLQIPSILEKVITKCKVKSYFRLQQTCEDLQEFVKNTENISVHLGENELSVCRKQGSSFYLATRAYGKCINVSLQNLYGVLLGNLYFAVPHCENTEELDTLLEILKTNGIKCMEISRCIVNWTTEQFTNLLKIVKPSNVDISLSSSGELSSFYEIILKKKHVKEVSLCLGPDEFFPVAKRFMTTFPIVTIFTKCAYHEDIDVPYGYCDAILQIIHTESPQNLRDFYFSNLFGPRYPTVTEMEEQFRQYNPRVEESSEPRYSISAWVDLPETLPSNAFCKIRFGWGGLATAAAINFGMRGPDGQPMTKFPLHFA